MASPPKIPPEIFGINCQQEGFCQHCFICDIVDQLDVLLSFQTRIEILGILDRSSGNIRLRCADPKAQPNQAEKFANLLRPMPVWVQKGSKIIADNSIDKERLMTMGYGNVVQSTYNRRSQEGTNNQIMEYLNKVVPKVFTVRQVNLGVAEQTKSLPCR